MLPYKTDEEFKGQIEHTIEWNEQRIGSIKKWINTLNEWLKRSSGADTESILSGITNSEDAIKTHRQFIANAQERYVELCGYRYGWKPKRPTIGKPALTVIKGKKKDADGLSNEFRTWRDKNA